MKWFKHYTDAHDGDTIMQLWASGKGELVGFYWTLLELICQYGDQHENLGKWRFNLSTLARKLFVTRGKARRMLVQTCSNFNITLEEVSPEFYSIFVHNMLEIKETRGKKSSKSSEIRAGEVKKIRSKEDKNTEKQESSPGIAALADINKAIKTNFKPVPANLKFIDSRLAEGASLQDLIDVARVKSTQWRGDPKMKKYIRVETLYNATKFQSYMTEVHAAREMEKVYDAVFGPASEVSADA